MGLRYFGYPRLTDVIPTTDATPTVSTPCSYVVPAGAKGRCHMRLEVHGATSIAYAEAIVAFRNDAGVLTRLTAIPVVALAGDAGLLTAVLDSTQTGTTFQPRVTGIAATNLTHTLDCTYWLD